MNLLLKSLLFIVISAHSSSVFCQNYKNKYDHIVYNIEGDLNNDGLSDLVIVREDTVNKFNPYLLEIKFGTSNGAYKTALTSEQAVMNKYPDGNESNSIILEKLEIKKGILIFTNQLIRGNLVHKFRYQNGNFELIGYTFNNASPGYVELLDYNLSTGKKVLIKREYETDKIIEKTETIEKLSPLPKLQKFAPLDYVY